MLKLLIGLAFFSASVSSCPSIAASDEMSQRPNPVKLGTRAPDSCGSQVIERFVGANAEPSVRQAIAAAIGHDRIRWIKPGTAVTQDFSPERLNVILDHSGRIMTMRCG